MCDNISVLYKIISSATRSNWKLFNGSFWNAALWAFKRLLLNIVFPKCRHAKPLQHHLSLRVCAPVSRCSFQRHSWKIVPRTSRRSHYRGRLRRWKSVRCVNKSRAIFKTLHYGIFEQNAVPKCIWPKSDPEINSELICAVGCFSFFNPFLFSQSSHHCFFFLSCTISGELSEF